MVCECRQLVAKGVVAVVVVYDLEGCERTKKKRTTRRHANCNKEHEPFK